MLRVAAKFTVLLAIILGFSLLLGPGAAKREEGPARPPEPVIIEGMTFGDFAEANRLSPAILDEVFGVEGAEALRGKVSGSGLSKAEIAKKVNSALAFEAEEKSKDWVKIALKFALWTVALSAAFALLRKKSMSDRWRNTFYLGGILLFGSLLGPDPSPMGTVKDAIVLYGSKGILFPPRFVAMGVFLLIVFLANKLICAYGCQVGLLQDLIYRINRKANRPKGVLPQLKPPFILANTIRGVFFISIVVAAFLWGLDLVEPIDPFKIYRVATLSAGGLVFVLAIMALSLFVYRPWCHFACPFGLVSWAVEQVSLYKIKVNRETCTSCGKCSERCPSTVMGEILKGKRITPDCYACGTCVTSCPTASISFDKGKRTKKG